MAAGACMNGNSHKTSRPWVGGRGPGNIEGLGRTGQKYGARSKRMSLKSKGAKA